MTSDGETTVIVNVNDLDKPSPMSKTRHSATSSISSVGSDSSTGQLIKSLSMHELNQDGNPTVNEDISQDKADVSKIRKVVESNPIGEQNAVNNGSSEVESSKSSESDSAKENSQTGEMAYKTRKNKNIPKPVKFTVRKVSHEPVNSPPIGRNVLHSPTHNDVTIKSQDHISAAQIKYDRYTSRVDKIEKEIAFLTNLLPPYNVEVDYPTRTKVAGAIAKLKMKQDELEKKKYDLGRTLSRLWRENDESHIWVRDVTNN